MQTPTFTKEQLGELSESIIEKLASDDIETAFSLLKPVLDSKCPFRDLDRIAIRLGEANSENPTKFLPFLDKVVRYNAMGSYVIAATALAKFLEKDPEMVMEKTREYAIFGDAWHVCDNMGERSLGPALVDYFDETIPWLQKFLDDDNIWMKRIVGVAIHYFHKKVQDDTAKTKLLLDLIAPYIEIKEPNTAKGLGWGIKTIGKHHPDLATDYLVNQLEAGKKVSKIIIRKALTYLPEENKEKILAHV